MPVDVDAAAPVAGCVGWPGDGLMTLTPPAAVPGVDPTGGGARYASSSVRASNASVRSRFSRRAEFESAT
jgi:hypothetical protein